MTVTCKCCGRQIETEGQYSNPEPKGHVCNKCADYCMKKCNKASSVKGWHYEPCLSCGHNPTRGKRKCPVA